MKNRFIITFLVTFLVLAFLASCVSKKKYNDAAKQIENKINEKSVLEEVLNKLAVENDSLGRLVILLDSMYRSELLKMQNNVAVNGKKEERSVKFKVKQKMISGKDEYNKKAIFIYNFISYISWPNDPKAESFSIGIVGESPLKAPLQGYVYGKSVNKLPISVETYQPNKNYHILFFSEMGQSSFNKIKKALVNKPVLYITENTLLENIGSHITLFVDGNKVKYSVNKAAMERTKFKVSDAFYTLSSD
jgi:hypothetical protein